MFPKAFKEEVVDVFSKRSDVGGFTLSQVEGFSAAAGFRSDAERIHGRGPRVQVQLIVGREDATNILRDVKSALPRREIAYWLSVVDEFGTLG